MDGMSECRNQASGLSPSEQRELVKAANFTERDIKRFYKRFRALDTNQNGELDPHELFDVPEVAEVCHVHTQTDGRSQRRLTG